MSAMRAVQELASAPTGTVHDFLQHIRDALAHDDVAVGNLMKVEHKFSAAGYLFLDQLLDARREALEDCLATSPPVSGVWLATIERMGSFKFKPMSLPSQCIVTNDERLPAAARRGGNREHKLKCPVHGVEPLGGWLRDRDQLKDVAEFFSQIGLYRELIQIHKFTIFKAKPIQVHNADTVKLLTNTIVKVCDPYSDLSQTLSPALASASHSPARSHLLATPSPMMCVSAVRT